MLWGYLNEFWEAIIAVGDYSIEWFESVGNAVAGAIGGLFEDLVHHIYDIFYLIEWFLANINDILNIGLTPLVFIFNFVKGFFVSATSTLAELGITMPEIVLLTDNVSEFFDTMPYMSLLFTGVGGALGLFVFIFLIKKIIHI